MGRKPSERCNRVAVEIRRAISHVISKNTSDPRLENVTVTGVDINRDLRIAKIYFSVHKPGGTVERAVAGFLSAKGYLRRELAGRVNLRYMPELKFFYDESFDYGSRVDKVLKSIKN